VNISNDEKEHDFLIGHSIVIVEKSSFLIHCTLATPWLLFEIVPSNNL
jgi:hypothetical protein